MIVTIVRLGSSMDGGQSVARSWTPGMRLLLCVATHQAALRANVVRNRLTARTSPSILTCSAASRRAWTSWAVAGSRVVPARSCPRRQVLLNARSVFLLNSAIKSRNHKQSVIDLSRTRSLDFHHDGLDPWAREWSGVLARASAIAATVDAIVGCHARLTDHPSASANGWIRRVSLVSGKT